MKKFIKKMRYRIASFIAPKNACVVPISDIEEHIKEARIASNVKGVKQGVRMGIGIILGFMKHLNGKSAEDWCKEAYDYTEWKIDNLSFEVERIDNEEGVKIRISVPKDFEDENGDEDLTAQ